MRLEELIARVLLEPVERIDDRSSPRTLRNWNSICHVELTIALEDEFAVKFARNEIPALTTVGRIREVLRVKGVDI